MVANWPIEAPTTDVVSEEVAGDSPADETTAPTTESPRGPDVTATESTAEPDSTKQPEESPKEAGQPETSTKQPEESPKKAGRLEMGAEAPPGLAVVTEGPAMPPSLPPAEKPPGEDVSLKNEPALEHPQETIVAAEVVPIVETPAEVAATTKAAAESDTEPPSSAVAVAAAAATAQDDAKAPIVKGEEGRGGEGEKGSDADSESEGEYVVVSDDETRSTSVVGWHEVKGKTTERRFMVMYGPYGDLRAIEWRDPKGAVRSIISTAEIAAYYDIAADKVAGTTTWALNGDPALTMMGVQYATLAKNKDPHVAEKAPGLLRRLHLGLCTLPKAGWGCR